MLHIGAIFYSQSNCSLMLKRIEINSMNIFDCQNVATTLEVRLRASLTPLGFIYSRELQKSRLFLYKIMIRAHMKTPFFFRTTISHSRIKTTEPSKRNGPLQICTRGSYYRAR